MAAVRDWSESDLRRLRSMYSEGAAASTMMAELQRARHELFPAIAHTIILDTAQRMDMLRLCVLYNLGPEEIAVLLNVYETPVVAHLVDAVLMLEYREIISGAWPMQRLAFELRSHSPTAPQLAELWRTLAECELCASAQSNSATSDAFDLAAHRWRLSGTDRAIVACRLYPEHARRRAPVIMEWVRLMRA